MTDSCLFCKIVNREIPAAIVYEDSDILAFKDARAQAPVHLLIIPKTHIEKLSDFNKDNAEIFGRIILTANKLAGENGIDSSGYRVVVNCGRDAGQAVFHMHAHLLGGRPMTWPPG